MLIKTNLRINPSKRSRSSSSSRGLIGDLNEKQKHPAKCVFTCRKITKLLNQSSTKKTRGAGRSPPTEQECKVQPSTHRGHHSTPNASLQQCVLCRMRSDKSFTALRGVTISPVSVSAEELCRGVSDLKRSLTPHHMGLCSAVKPEEVGLCLQAFEMH